MSEGLIQTNFTNWHLPSPNKTPDSQSSRFAYNPSHLSPTAPGQNWTETQYGWMTESPISNIQSTCTNGQSIRSKQRSSNLELFNHCQGSRGLQPNFTSEADVLGDGGGFSPEQNPFSIGSLNQSCDGTSREDTDAALPNMDQSFSSSQMQTPPPTRDSDTRRKPQQPRIAEFATPITDSSRRLSTPNDSSWLRRSSDMTFLDPSPFNFNPFQFSPQQPTGFTPSGPMTAPAYSQNDLFWEPNSNHTLNQMSFSTVDEEAISAASDNFSTSFSFEPPLPSTQPAVPHGPAQSHFRSNTDFSRPQTNTFAAPRQNKSQIDSSSFLSTTSGVDPTMLWTSPTPVGHSNPQTAPVRHLSNLESRQPYQHQIESLRREKEERARRANKRSSLITPLDYQPLAPKHNLRRSLTEVRARKSLSHSQRSSGNWSNELSDITHSLDRAHIPRESSPLKRNRVDAPFEHQTPTKSKARRSIALTVDESGHAEVKIVPECANSSKQSDTESDSSDSAKPGSSQRTLSHKSVEPDSQLDNASNDAQNALKQVVRDRREKRQARNSGAVTRGLNSRLSATTAHSAHHRWQQGNRSGVQAGDNVSPTTISDPELETPTRPGNNSLQGGSPVRCICNGSVSNNLEMIECESCQNWSHTECLGIDSFNIPPVFICIFCSSTPATRGGRVRHFQNAPLNTMGSYRPARQR